MIKFGSLVRNQELCMWTRNEVEYRSGQSPPQFFTCFIQHHFITLLPNFNRHLGFYKITRKRSPPHNSQAFGGCLVW